MIHEFEVEFLVDGMNHGSSVIQVIDGVLSTEIVEQDFYDMLRKNRNSFLQDADEAIKDKIVSNLTSAQEDKLKEEHAKDYHGTDDDMPDAFESWLEDLSGQELYELLKDSFAEKE